MIEPAEVSKGVYVGRALMPRQENDLPVSVINTTNADIEIEKGTLLTEAVPVNVPVREKTRPNPLRNAGRRVINISNR